MLLEAGIIFHSIMIGVSLGASGGAQWRPLFIGSSLSFSFPLLKLNSSSLPAIVFHQMFEGLALGSRIGMLIWPAGQGWKKWAMAGAFGVRFPFPASLSILPAVLTRPPPSQLITPVGIAIGMGVHAGYNPNSGAALLSIGILDSISAGILIYGGLVEMLYHDVRSSFRISLLSVCFGRGYRGLRRVSRRKLTIFLPASSCSAPSPPPSGPRSPPRSSSSSPDLSAWSVALLLLSSSFSLTFDFSTQSVLGKWA